VSEITFEIKVKVDTLPDPSKEQTNPRGRKTMNTIDIGQARSRGREGTDRIKIRKTKENRSGERVAPAGAARIIRPPTLRDGVAVHDLIRSCPPLDINSLYCNLLQCTHFASTCAIAIDGVDGESVLGWLSAHRPPTDPETLFVWQVAVAPAARRTGLAHALLDDILAREACRGVVRVGASVTATNVASLGFFESFARRWGSHVELAPWLDESEAFGSRHDSEWSIRIDEIQAGQRPPVQVDRHGRREGERRR
jgi:L-2,4-diaminobutyric acid acetyltransferase